MLLRSWRNIGRSNLRWSPFLRSCMQSGRGNRRGNGRGMCVPAEIAVRALSLLEVKARQVFVTLAFTRAGMLLAMTAAVATVVTLAASP